MTGSPKTTRWAKLPAGKSSELNTKSNQATRAGGNATSKHLKLNIARKNWEEAMNPAAAFVRTKKAKKGAYVSTGSLTPRGKKKAAEVDAAFEHRDSDGVKESRCDGEDARNASVDNTSSGEPCSKPSDDLKQLLYSDTGSCYYLESTKEPKGMYYDTDTGGLYLPHDEEEMSTKNDLEIYDGDRTLYTSVTATGLAQAVLVSATGLPLIKHVERNDNTSWTRISDLIEVTLRAGVAKWNEVTRACSAASCHSVTCHAATCQVAGTFDHSGGPSSLT
jgi:hypothetical protein